LLIGYHRRESLKKSIFVLFLILTIICTTFASDLGRVMEQLRRNTTDLYSKVNEVKWERKLELYKFFTKNIPVDDIEKYEYLLDKTGNLSDLNIKLSLALKKYYPDYKERNNLISNLKMSSVNTSYLTGIADNITEAIYLLREPQNDGSYKYAKYEKSGDQLAENEQLTVKYTIDSLGTYSRKFDSRVYMIKIYSPKKRGLFEGNRDFYVKDIKIKYSKDGREKIYNKNVEKWIKRGESYDLVFPEVYKSPEVNVRYGTKKEHKNRATMGFEFVKATLMDSKDNPNYALLQELKNLGTADTKDLDSLSLKLKGFLKNADLGSGNISVAKNSNLGNNKSSMPSNDKLMYFYYMLKDDTNKRENLINKFENMFLK